MLRHTRLSLNDSVELSAELVYCQHGTLSRRWLKTRRPLSFKAMGHLKLAELFATQLVLLLKSCSRFYASQVRMQL